MKRLPCWFQYVCHKISGIVQYSSITFGDPENVCCPWNFTDILFLSEVKITSGVGRERDAILVIWHWSVRHVVVSSFAEFVDTQNRKLRNVSKRIFDHPYSRMIWKFHFGSRHLGFQAEVDVTRYRKWHRWKACPRRYGDSRWNLVAACSRTRDTPGGRGVKIPQLPANVAKKLSPGQGLNKTQRC